MNKKFFLTAMCVALLVMTGCRTASQPVGGAPALQLSKEQTWQLVAIQGKAVGGDARPVTLRFNPEAGTCHGHAACNDYYGEYRLTYKGGSDAEGDSYDLSLSLLGSGSVRCTEPDMNAEERYMALLRKADGMCLTAYTLTLYRRGKEILKYELQ